MPNLIKKTTFFFLFSAQSELTNHALGRSLVCQVHSQDKSGISIVLYDTSNSDEDVNINEKLIQIYRPNNGALKTSNGSSNTPSRRESPGESQMSKLPSKIIFLNFMVFSF